MAAETIFNFNLSLSANADVSIEFQGTQGYYSFSGNSPWAISVSLDGTVIKTISGAGVQAENPVVVCGRQNVAAGTRNVTITWWGQSSMVIHDCDVVVHIRYK